MGAAGSAGEESELGAPDFKAGDRVIVQGLEKRPDLNGCAGTLGQLDEANGRWSVLFESGGGARVKPDNLRRYSPPKEAGEEEEEEEEEQGDEDGDDDAAVLWDEAEHRGLLPVGGEFTADELRRWDGVELPMCLGVCGVVVDVSSSQNFKPSHGYGKLWGGRDCTLAMAKTSLKAEDAGRFDWKLEDLDEGSFSALAGWYKHYTAKYPVVGRLKELDGWDFSGVLSAAGAAGAPSFAGKS